MGLPGVSSVRHAVSLRVNFWNVRTLFSGRVPYGDAASVAMQDWARWRLAGERGRGAEPGSRRALGRPSRATRPSWARPIRVPRPALVDRIVTPVQRAMCGDVLSPCCPCGVGRTRETLKKPLCLVPPGPLSASLSRQLPVEVLHRGAPTRRPGSAAAAEAPGEHARSVGREGSHREPRLIGAQLDEVVKEQPSSRVGSTGPANQTAGSRSSTSHRQRPQVP